MRLKHSFALLLIVSLTLSVSVPIFYGGLESFRVMGRLPLWGLVLLLGMVLLGWRLNAARLQLLGSSLGLRLSGRQALSTVVATEFASAATPAGSGGPPTLVFLLTEKGLSTGRSAGMLAVDALADLVFFGTAIPIAILLFFSRSGVSHPLLFGGLLLTLILAGLALLWLVVHKHRSILLWLGNLARRIRFLARFRFRMARMVVHFRQAVALLIRMPLHRLLALYLFTAGHWLLRYSVLAVLLWLLKESVPWAYLFLVQSILLFGGQILLLPGGGGGVEIGFGALLSAYLNPATSALTLIVWRFCTFYWYLLVGAPVFILQTGRAARRLLAPAG